MFREQWAITPEKRCHRGGYGDVYQSRSTQAAVKMNNCARPQWSAVTNNDEKDPGIVSAFPVVEDDVRNFNAMAAARHRGGAAGSARHKTATSALGGIACGVPRKRDAGAVGASKCTCSHVRIGLSPMQRGKYRQPTRRAWLWRRCCARIQLWCLSRTAARRVRQSAHVATVALVFRRRLRVRCALTPAADAAHGVALGQHNERQCRMAIIRPELFEPDNVKTTLGHDHFPALVQYSDSIPRTIASAPLATRVAKEVRQMG